MISELLDQGPCSLATMVSKPRLRTAKPRPKPHLCLSKMQLTPTFVHTPYGEPFVMKKTTDLNPVGATERKLKDFFSRDVLVYLASSVLAFVLITSSVFFSLKIKHLNTNYSLKDFFPEQHALLERDALVKKTFSLKESPTLYFILSRKDGSSWLNEKAFKQMELMTDYLKTRSDIKSVLSFSSLEGAQLSKEGIQVGPVLENKTQAMRIRLVEQNPILKPMLLSKNSNSAVLVIEPVAHDPTKIKDLANYLKKQMGRSMPNVETLIAGIPAIQFRLAEVIHSDLSIFIVIVMIVFCGMFYFLFQQVEILLFAFGALLLVNLCVMGTIAYFRIPFSAILSTLPILVSISSMSILVHTLHLWSQVEKAGTLSQRFHQSLDKIKELFLPNFLGSLTTAIGFAALASSSIPVIKKYGMVVGVSVLAAWLLMQIYLIAGLVWLKPKMKLESAHRSSWSLWGMKHAGAILLGTLAFTFLVSIFIPKIQFSSKLFDDLPETDAIRVATEKFDRDFGGIVNYEIILSSSVANYWKRADAQKALRSFTSEVSRFRGVGSAISHFDFLPAEMLKSQAATAEAFFLYSLSAENPLKQFITEDGRQARVLIRLHDVPTKEIDSVRAAVKSSAFKKFSSFVRIQESGLALNSHTINQEVARHLVFGFWESLLLIGLFLVFLFRSLRWALIACVPNLIPPILLMGVMGYFQTSVKPGVALIFSIVLGLAFNNTVYLLSRLKSLLEKHGSFQKCLKESLLQEGNPCASETLIMLSGFSIFIFSSFTMNKMFGGFMILTIIFGFIADLLFLPALLSYFPEIGATSLVKSKARRPLSKLAPVAPLVLLAIVFMGSRSQGLTVQQILSQSSKSVATFDDQAEVQMDIIEANNEVKVRKFKMKTMSSNGFHALIRMQEPSDIKNTGFLSQIKGGEEQQWIYLPSTKQVRRVTSKKSENGILGSEISSEDLSAGMVKTAKVTVSGNNPKFHVLSIQFPKGQTKYTHAYSYLDKKTFVPMMTVYYQGQKKIKTVDFTGYKLVDKKIWRAQEIKVVNHLNNRRTNLKFKSYKVNVGAKAKDFSQAALKDES
jgi:uncharacterized protein